MDKVNMATTAMTDIVTRIQHRRTMIVIFTVRLSPFEQCKLLPLPYSILEYYSYICWIWVVVVVSMVVGVRIDCVVHSEPLRVDVTQSRAHVLAHAREGHIMVGAAPSTNNNNMVVWVKYKAICCCCIQIYYS